MINMKISTNTHMIIGWNIILVSRNETYWNLLLINQIKVENRFKDIIYLTFFINIISYSFYNVISLSTHIKSFF